MYFCRKYCEGDIGPDLAQKLDPIILKLQQRGINTAKDNWFREFTKPVVPPYVLDDNAALEVAQLLHIVEKESVKDNETNLSGTPSLYLLV